MQNLTASTIVLFPAAGATPIILPPSRAVTTKEMREGLILKGEMIDIGAGAMDSATLNTPAPARITAFNRMLETQIAEDRAINGGYGLVLIRKDLLRYVQPKLARHVAAPHPDAGPNTEDPPRITTSILIRPPEPAEQRGRKRQVSTD